MKPIIRVENLSKQYRIGAGQKRYSTLRESLVETIQTPFRAFRRNGNRGKNSFWALKDINFEVYPGEVVGIIGRNGAGKSTLLKILSRITKQTTGRVELYGRIGSLLEVGTGFHPELTGRENVFLNGSILGMRRDEIARKFDEIVDFAEIEQFLDTPVKHYSSGMYMRLAFAVAANLEPEILVVDEVLSVGDAKFQNKCLGKMEKISEQGRTILFVSHNIAVVRQLCSTGILLDKGKLHTTGTADAVLSEYLKKNEEVLSEKIISDYGVELVDMNLTDSQTGEVTFSPTFNQSYQLNLQIKAHTALKDTALLVRLYDELGQQVSSICSFEEGAEPFLLDGQVNISFPIPRLQLYPGTYSVSLLVSRLNDDVYFDVDRCFSFEVQPAIVQNSPWAYTREHGVVRISDGCQVSSVG